MPRSSRNLPFVERLYFLVELVKALHDVVAGAPAHFLFSSVPHGTVFYSLLSLGKAVVGVFGSGNYGGRRTPRLLREVADRYLGNVHRKFGEKSVGLLNKNFGALLLFFGGFHAHSMPCKLEVRNSP